MEILTVEEVAKRCKVSYAKARSLLKKALQDNTVVVVSKGHPKSHLGRKADYYGVPSCFLERNANVVTLGSPWEGNPCTATRGVRVPKTTVFFVSRDSAGGFTDPDGSGHSPHGTGFILI